MQRYAGSPITTSRVTGVLIASARNEQMDPSAYQCLTHRVSSQREATPIIALAQSSLRIELGPVFQADLLEVDNQNRIIISMVAHHLCVDLVSWRIIVQDLSHLLETGTLVADAPLPFRSWCALQAAHTKALDPKTLLPFRETPADLSYWGATGPFTYGRTKTEEFSLGEDMTKLALADCHVALRSEPVDLFLAAIAQAFARTFKDRTVPTLHIEGHGRDAAVGSLVDSSRTVGWFTTICPLVVPVEGDDPLDAVKLTKDIRRSVPGHGKPYFAHKYLSGVADTTPFPMELLFNYLGGGVVQADQRTGNAESLISQVDLDDDDVPADVGPETIRLALFEISAMVTNNKLRFSFVYDCNLDRVGEIQKWISTCKNTLEETIRGLVHHSVEPTLSDYPLLPVTYDGLRRLTQVDLPRAGLDRADVITQVEDIYPCTPVQEGMLISQLRDSSAYIFHAVYDVRHSNPYQRLDSEKIARAWQKVVDRHAALRTMFIESVRRGGVFDQVVLKKADSGAVLFTSSDKEALGKLSRVTIRKSNTGIKQPQLPHQLAICTTHSGRVLMKLEVNHAAIDGGSLAIILEELAAGYMGCLEAAPGPLYSDYVQHINSLPAKEGIDHWKCHLSGLQSCYFPKLNTATNGNGNTRTLRSVALDFNRFAELRKLSEQTHVTLANIMHAAWAFVLRKYTQCDDVCFGYLTAGRDAPVENIGHVVGTLINMLCFRVQFSLSQSLEDVFRTAQDQHLQSVPFQHVSLARVQHELGLAGKPLYNTSISIQNHSGLDEGEVKDTILLEMEEAHDPSEVCVTEL